jgi:hypothetical protein
MLKVPQSTDEYDPVAALQERRTFRRIAAGALAVIAVLALASGIIYWRATTAEIRLGFFGGRVEAALKERLPPDARVAVGWTSVSYRTGQGVILRVKNLELVLPGTARVSASELSTNTTVSALLSGRVDLQSVTASGVEIGVSAPPSLAGGEGSGADLIRRAAKIVMDQMLSADSLIRATGLQSVTVRNASIEIDDQGARPTGAPLKITEASWVPLGTNRSKVWMQALEKNGSDWDVTVERRQIADGASSLTIEIEDLPSSALIPALSGEGGGPYLRSTLNLQFRIGEAASGNLLGVRGIVSAAGGTFSLNGVDEVNVQVAALTFRLDENGDRMAIPSGEVSTRTGRLRFEGIADLAERGRITLLTRVLGGALPTPIGDARFVELVGGGGVARIDLVERGIEIEQFSLLTPDGSASAIGQASLRGETPGLSFALSLSRMPAAVVRALWPPFVAAKTRLWFDINVKSGMVGPATLTVALPPDNIGPRARGKVLPSTALVGSLPFENGVFSPIRTFPVIENAVGGITFGNATASIWAQTGTVDVPGRGQLQAGGTTLIIPELGRLEPRGDLHLELAGSAAALAAVSNTPPLAIAAKQGLMPEALSGDAQLSLDANIPIYESNFADVTPAFRLGLTNFSSTSPIDNRMITEADLVLEGSAKSYTVRGEGTLDGLKAQVDLLRGTAVPKNTSAVAITLDADARERLGFAFGNLVTGPVIASLTQTDQPIQQVALDLKESQISLPFLGWEKGPGVPATASFLMAKKSTGTDITDFLLSGKGFEAKGILSFGLDGRLKSMELEKVALRTGDQLTVSAVADGSGYDVRVRGAALDARGILQGVRSGSVGGTADIFPIAIDLNVGVVKGQNDVALSDVGGSLRVTSNGLDAASLAGKTNENQSFEWTLGREGDTRVLRLLADGGGALIRFSGIYSRVAGGSLVLDYSGPIGGTGTGVAVLRDFRLLNERAFEPALNRNPLPREDLTRVPQTTNPNDLQFSQLRIPFRQSDWVITISEAALRGAALGATANGTINIPGGKMAISGALIPMFGINNVPGSIPLLGALFGGRDEGLFGITYRMYGPLDEPQFSMNPISALAPGIFRKIFEQRQ